MINDPIDILYQGFVILLHLFLDFLGVLVLGDIVEDDSELFWRRR